MQDVDVPTQEVERGLIVRSLDSLFGLDTEWKEIVDPSAGWIEKIYAGTDVDWAHFFNPNYGAGYNGLMLEGSEKVKKVYLISFWSPSVLEEILSKGEENVMIFAHHHFDMETGGRAFLPIEKRFLDQMAERNITMYFTHAPADCSTKLGTNTGIAKALNAEIVESFVPYGKGMAGRVVELPEAMKGSTFIERMKELFDVEPTVWNLDPEKEYKRIGVCAGGGDDVEIFEEAENLGCELYLTGEVVSRVEGDWARDNNAKIEPYLENSKMAYVAVSHCASEELWLQNQMVPWFQKLGVGAEFIRNPEPWR